MTYNRSYDFLCKNNILYFYLAFVNDVSSAIDRGMKTIGIFTDLSKAFDTTDHNILLHKLWSLEEYLTIGPNYLCNRKQYVSYNSSKSTTENVTCGVPHESILGPLLFLLYMNDISYLYIEFP